MINSDEQENPCRKRVLTFRPTNEEYDYLKKTNTIDKWSDTCHQWIQQQQKQDRYHLFETLQKGLLPIILGLLVFLISLTSTLDPLFLIGFFAISTICIITGIITFLWGVRNHV